MEGFLRMDFWSADHICEVLERTRIHFVKNGVFCFSPLLIYGSASAEEFYRSRCCLYQVLSWIFVKKSSFMDREVLWVWLWKLGVISFDCRTCMQVSFILVEAGKWPQMDFVVVNMDGSRHPLPLTTVYHQLQPVNPSPYTFLQALFGHEYPVSLLLITSLALSFPSLERRMFRNSE